MHASNCLERFLESRPISKALIKVVLFITQSGRSRGGKSSPDNASLGMMNKTTFYIKCMSPVIFSVQFLSSIFAE